MATSENSSSNASHPASRIISVEARTVTIPLDTPTSFSTRQVFARDYVVVRIRTEDGHEGQGFCYGGSRGGSLVATADPVGQVWLYGELALNRVQGDVKKRLAGVLEEL